MAERTGSTWLTMNGPLAGLAGKLKDAAPPSLDQLVSMFGSFEHYAEFVALVKEYTPEHEDEIMRLPGFREQVATFASRFQDKYFPIRYTLDSYYEDEIEGYETITAGIPIFIQSMDWEDIEMMPSEGRIGHKLMTVLVELPDDGLRVPLIEACEKLVPRELLERIPAGGFQDLHRLLKGVKFKALATWRDILNHDTDNYFLDTDNEMFWSSGPPEWDMENVRALTTLWQQGEAAWDETHNMQVWLEKDPAKNFRELLEFIEKRRQDDERKQTGIPARPAQGA